ncbi:MAG: UpxY family transcription antiterminator [Bacteroidota bacterium]
MNWQVIYTKSRSEKAVAEKLQRAGLEVFCPLLKQKKQWSDRWKWVEEPLFRSYCFIRSDQSAREMVLQTPGVVQYVFHCGKPAVIRDKEMELLQTWLAGYEHNNLEAGILNPEDRVRLKTGALIEKEAIVVESKGNHATLFLRDIGMKIKVDLRQNLVEKIN